MSSSAARGSAKSSESRGSRFKEHLSITVPPPELDLSSVYIVKSKFSAESLSPPPPFSRIRSASSSSRTLRAYSRNAKDIEASGDLRSPPQSAARLRDRFTRFLFDVRTLRSFRTPSEREQPIQQLGPWPPLHIEKRHPAHCICTNRDHKKRKRRMFLWIILLIFMLFLFINVAVLDSRVVYLQSLINQNSSETASEQSSVLSVSQQQCLAEYEVNAPSNPSSYPCSTCLPLLQSAPTTFTSANTSAAQVVNNAIEFCALKGILDVASSASQTALMTEGWLQDVNFCTWNGVTCDSSGRVFSLVLSPPALPSILPDDMGALSHLQNLTIRGDSENPNGSFPPTFTNLTSLRILDLESTTLGPLPDDLFTEIPGLVDLSLVSNTQMGGSLPVSMAQSHVRSLVMTSQNLSTEAFNTLFSSETLRSSLQVVSLTSDSITGSLPSSLGLLFNLEALVLQSNMNLTGTMPSAVCNLSSLKSCSVQDTQITPPAGANNCGVCQFS